MTHTSVVQQLYRQPTAHVEGNTGDGVAADSPATLAGRTTVTGGIMGTKGTKNVKKPKQAKDKKAGEQEKKK